jgi:hypothetical protein
MNHTVIDNYLTNEELEAIKKIVCGARFPWFYGDYVSGPGDNKDFYFIHTFYGNNTINSNFFSEFTPILEKIKPKALIRGRALLYIGKNKLIEHGKHIDFDYPHKTFILYLNTNDGFTRLHDGQCINSVENRALFFDGSLEHNSTNCTDQKTRKLITISYF